MKERHTFKYLLVHEQCWSLNGNKPASSTVLCLYFIIETKCSIYINLQILVDKNVMKSIKQYIYYI